jgi:hypothetical protein
MAISRMKMVMQTTIGMRYSGGLLCTGIVGVRLGALRKRLDGDAEEAEGLNDVKIVVGVVIGLLWGPDSEDMYVTIACSVSC